MRLFFVVLFVLVNSCISFAQQDSLPAPPYKRFPSVPPLKLLGIDSVSVFTKSDLKKNRAVLIMLFNPTCDHCKHETEGIIRNINAFKKIQILMATSASITLMKEFHGYYNIGKFETIFMGQDYQNILPSFYMIRNLPYLAMYDKKGKLLTTFEGAMKIEDIINVFQ